MIKGERLSNTRNKTYLILTGNGMAWDLKFYLVSTPHNDPMSVMFGSCMIASAYFLMNICMDGYFLALFPSAQKKNQIKVPSIHCLCMRGSPGFSGATWKLL